MTEIPRGPKPLVDLGVEKSAPIIYAARNPAMPGLIMIGKTPQDPDSRLSDLYTTGVPVPFVCVCAISPDRPAAEIEQMLHEVFGPYRENPDREFFRIEPEQIVAILRVLGEDITDQWQAAEDSELSEANKRSRASLPPRGSQYPQGFWQGFREFVQDQNSTTLKLNKPGGRGRWMVAGTFGISGTHIGAVRLPKEPGLCAELVLTGRSRAQRYECLLPHRERIRSGQRFPEELTWSRERTRMYWILTTDIDDETQRMKQYRWLFERLEELKRLFAPLLRELNDLGWPVAERDTMN